MEITVATLYGKIGQLYVENEILKIELQKQLTKQQQEQQQKQQPQKSKQK
jgi:hypothetical protein